MSDMIERVARAVAIQAFKTHNRRDGSLKQYITPDDYAEKRWKIYELEARAAIQAAGAVELEQALSEALHFIDTMPVTWTGTRRLQEIAAKYSEALK